MKQRILIVDDSPFIRRILTDWLSSQPDLEIVGCAADGQEAVDKVKALRPDLVTLDIEMPRRDGLSALEEIMRDAPTKVLMVSSLTTEGTDLTMRALELGAYDFVAKPGGANAPRFVSAQDELLEKIHSAKFARLGRSAPSLPAAKLPAARTSDRVVLLASSTGGPRALTTLFEGLPEGLNVPVLMVQHMPAGFTESFARRLDALGKVSVREAQDGDQVTPGLALLAPGGSHMLVRHDGSIELNEAPPVHGVRPAADPLFVSAAQVFGRRCLGVVLTGMGRDGAEGAVTVRKVGGTVLGESEKSATIYGMPKAAFEAGGIDAQFPITEMAAALVARLAGGTPRAA